MDLMPQDSGKDSTPSTLVYITMCHGGGGIKCYSLKQNVGLMLWCQGNVLNNITWQ